MSMCGSTGRRAGSALAALAIWAWWPAPLAACPVCFRVEESAATDGIVVAVLVLVSMTVGVLAGVGGFLIRRRTALFSSDAAAEVTTAVSAGNPGPVPESGKSVEKGYVPL